MTGRGQRLVIYVGESDSWRGRSLYMSILETLRKSGIAGATVMRGLAGFGAHSLIHTQAIERLSTDLPVVITVVDTEENIQRVVALVKPMVREGLMTLEDVQIVTYTHRYLHPLPADEAVQTIMTRDVVTVTPDVRAVDVIELLLGKLFKAVPVVDGDRRVVGIITDDDLLRAGMPVRLAVGQRLETSDVQALLATVSRDRTAGEIMSAPAITVPQDAALGHVVQEMLKRGLKRLPVVDGKGRLVGMVSRLDVLRAAAGYGVGQQETAPQPRPGRTLADLASAQVPSVHLNDDLIDVLQQMLATDVTYVVVLDEQQQPMGVITEGDLVARVTPVMRGSVLQSLAARVLGKDLRRGDALARDIMSERVLTAAPDTTLPDAIALMLREGRKRIVAVDGEGHAVGIVSRQTLLAATLED
jgi:CBS domain-containing protein